MDKLDFLDGGSPADAITPAETEDAGPARGPDGRFMSQAAEPAPEPEAMPEPAPVEPEPAPLAPPTPPEPGHVPLSAVLDEREKRQAAERELAELRRQHAQAQPQQPAVDPYADPAAFTQQVVLNTKLDMSEEMARSKHGDALVDQARDWALGKMAQSPAFNHEVLSNRHPYEYAVQAYQRDQMMAQLTPADLAQFKAWQAAQASLQATPQAAPAASPPPVAAPPRSLASATSAGGAAHVPSGDGQAFDAFFKR